MAVGTISPQADSRSKSDSMTGVITVKYYITDENGTTTSRQWSQTMIAFHLVNVYSRPTHSAVYRQRQRVSYCVCSSVEHSSIPCHHCSISSSFTLIMNPISSLFLIPILFYSSSFFPVPMQRLVISDIIIVFTFTFTFNGNSAGVKSV